MEFDTKISPRTLYRYIDMDFIPGVSNMDLPYKRNKKDKKKKDKPKAARSAKGKSIEERPREVNTWKEIGHWEMDTVLSAKDGSLERVLGLTERALDCIPNDHRRQRLRVCGRRGPGAFLYPERGKADNALLLPSL